MNRQQQILHEINLMEDELRLAHTAIGNIESRLHYASDQNSDVIRRWQAELNGLKLHANHLRNRIQEYRLILD